MVYDYEPVNASKVVKNRQSIEKKMIEKNASITLTDLAEFFYVPIKAIQKDMADIGAWLEEKDSPIDIEKMRALRDKRIDNALSSGKDEKKVLESFGLYRMPPEFETSKIHKDMKKLGVSEETMARVERSLYNMVIGIKLSHTSNNMHLSRLEKELIKSYSSEIKDTTEEIRDMAIDMVKSGQDAKSVSQMAGQFNQQTLENAAKHPSIVKGMSGGYKYERDEERSQHKQAKEQRKEECYQRWVSKECTQQELALEYGVTRITVMNWIRTKKMEHLSEREDPLTRQRNVKRSKKAEMDFKRQLILDTYVAEPDLTLQELADVTKTGYDLCRQTLVDAGLYATRYEENGIEDIKRGVKEAKRAYDRNIYAHFGYGPNKNQSLTRERHDYYNMLEGQHEMKEEIRRDPLLENAIKLGRGVGRLSRTYIKEAEIEDPERD